MQYIKLPVSGNQVFNLLIQPVNISMKIYNFYEDSKQTRLNFNENQNKCTNFSKILQYQFHENLLSGSGVVSMHRQAEGLTRVTSIGTRQDCKCT
jgi:hypothetical protein